MKKRPFRVSSPDRHPAEKLVLELLGVTGPSGREAEIVELVVQKLRQAGAPRDWIHTDQAHRRSPFGGQVGNLVLRLPGAGRGRRRLLMAHLDTVPLAEGAVPVVRGRYVVPADPHTALGADDRSGAAVLLWTAMEILRKRLPHPPLVFVWTVQEEVGLYGARNLKLALLGKPQLAFNFDGGSPEKVTVGATGGYRMAIDVEGVAAHAGSSPEEGVSAIAIASLAIAELHQQGWHGLIQKGGRSGTSNVGVVQGGQATNVVTPQVEVRAEARSHDPAFRRRIVQAIQRAFRKAAREVRNCHGVTGKVLIDGRLDYESFLLPTSDPSVLAAEAAVRRVGGQPARVVSNGGLDANWLSARGIPTVTLGCGQIGQHTAGERLDLDQFRRACDVALCLATGGESNSADLV